MRLDKYLKVSRIIKRRTVANEACDSGRVLVNGKAARASYNVKINDINAFMHDFGSECFKDTCHLTSEAFERLGKYVASELKKYF